MEYELNPPNEAPDNVLNRIGFDEETYPFVSRIVRSAFVVLRFGKYTR